MIVMKDVRAAMEVNRDSGVLADYLDAKVVELLGNKDGRIWVNVDGICVLRIRHVGELVVDVCQPYLSITDKQV
jgi:hypothetical protein